MIESGSEPERQAPGKFAWRLWERMTEIYGHKWVSSYGDEPNGAWCGVLAALTGEQVKRGLNALLNSTDPWPPTAIQFRQLCTGRDGQSWERQCHRIYEPEKLLVNLTAKEASQNAGASFFREMRSMGVVR